MYARLHEAGIGPTWVAGMAIGALCYQRPLPDQAGTFVNHAPASAVLANGVPCFFVPRHARAVG